MAIQYGDGSTSNDGRIIQCVTTNLATRTTISNFSNTGFSDLSGLSRTITLKSSGNEVLVMIMLNISHQTSGFAIPARVVRRVGGDNYVNIGNSNGSRIRGSFGYSQSSIPANAVTFIGRDSPGTTSQINYVLQLGSQSGQNVTINGTTSGNANNAGVNQAVFSSSITLMEIAD